ncbi:uncharacterized protein LOC133860512 [Alnus glutinosa]|uniref:uncharacterized protein LOC133860512 n=1 Tax=Alnus glutinosa TaxID=3517 RepID=UPI002D77605D|nr:uncharacterized protein LOC133860512 [Alnus glutinosa]
MASEIPSSSSPLPDNPPNTDNQPFQFSISPSIFTNPASPFYLPHGESSGTILVSQPLIGENYNTWSHSMIMALTAKNKLAFVDGSLLQPVVESGVEYQTWIRCNNMVLSWILNFVSKEIAASVIYIDTCHGMWLDLKERFSQKNGPRVFQLQKSISALTQDNFSILLMEPLPSINKVFSMITQEEKQQEISVKNPSFNLESAALMTAPVAWFVKQPYRKDKPVCTHCKVPGHIADKCYRLHGFPPGFKFTKNLNKPSSSHSANNVQESDLVLVTQPQQHDPPQALPQLTITPIQCQQLLSLLQQQSLVQ